MKTSQKLENKILYRIIKVSYILSLIISFIFVAALGLSEKPYESVNEEKSELICNSGNIYKLSSFESYWATYQDELSSTNDITARKVCLHQELKSSGLSETDIEKTINSSGKIEKNYQINLVKTTVGNWSNVFILWAIGIAISYISINLIRETILYIFFNTKFSWEWLSFIWKR